MKRLPHLFAERIGEAADDLVEAVQQPPDDEREVGAVPKPGDEEDDAEGQSV